MDVQVAVARSVCELLFVHCETLQQFHILLIKLQRVVVFCIQYELDHCVMFNFWDWRIGKGSHKLSFLQMVQQDMKYLSEVENHIFFMISES